MFKHFITNYLRRPGVGMFSTRRHISTNFMFEETSSLMNESFSLYKQAQYCFQKKDIPGAQKAIEKAIEKIGDIDEGAPQVPSLLINLFKFKEQVVNESSSCPALK
jgi:hypothetical protein